MTWPAAFLALIACVPAAPSDPSAETALKRAVSYLISKQGKDGGWHSETYGSMRQGSATTSLVLYALSHVPKSVLDEHRDSLKRAFRFLEVGIQKKGFVCAQDGTPEYPTYGTAMTLIAARRLKMGLDENDQKRLIRFLVSAQLDESREFAPDSPHYGGWDFSGAQHVIGRTSGTNISVARFVLEALAEIDVRQVVDVRQVKESVQRAREWTNRCQNFPDGDGGFFFTPEFRLQGNKAQTADSKNGSKPTIRSYGTTTCDGISCLVSIGIKRTDPRMKEAVNWLLRHAGLERVPGFEQFEQATGWEKGLRYYYYAGIANVLSLFPNAQAKRHRVSLERMLCKSQLRDGSWKNEATRMREDDPLIATSFAVYTLSKISKQD